MTSLTPKKDWCYEQHKNTNHMYDKYLPYEFHLRMTEGVGEQFKHLLDDTKEYYSDKPLEEFRDPRDHDTYYTERQAALIALPGHDLIEDCRITYNDCKEHLGPEAADIIYAVSNEKGKNRAERANERYYNGIKETKGATFVKMCDRIANVQYSKMTQSRMFEMYKKENDSFIYSMFDDAPEDLYERFEPMIEYLGNLFKD